MDGFDSMQWASLSGTSRTGPGTYNPFLSHAFLSALEESGCVARETGWLPRHLALEAPDGRLVGATPCYLKSHSQGEYVFDHGWADAFERAGGRYYPKLQVSIPFTPATGPRLLAPKGAAREGVQAALAEGLKTFAGQLGVSSAHVTFAPQEEVRILQDRGFLHRIDQQFHFTNDGYGNYDDFLSTLASRKRKALKKERRAALENGISIEWLTGRDLTESVWDDFHAFYMDTGSRKWGRPYLNRIFFSLIGERMADDILLVMARRNGRYIAGAINFIGASTLFGRHWGCVEDHPFLHFEVCYHQAIDFAIAKGLRTVEAGAQGEHKLARGYLPVMTHSAHWIEHEGLRNAVADYLEHERRQVRGLGDLLAGNAPFRKTGDGALR
ncbi:GNAT family N-acetyltransferase [Zhengella sp. ZM62]|uniref:GNAT family N-acetyltransferase n=1 Tax=Zhengella sedimenti TaxID=3390035 RepID=UPI0039771321